MNKDNIKNIEFHNSRIIGTLNRFSAEYSVPFDTLVNLAVLQFIDNINVIRAMRVKEINLDSLSEKILS